MSIQQLHELLAGHPIDPNDLGNFELLVFEGLIVDHEFGARLEWSCYSDAVTSVMAELSKPYLRQYGLAA